MLVGTIPICTASQPSSSEANGLVPAQAIAQSAATLTTLDLAAMGMSRWCLSRAVWAAAR
jgi:hypothetical protein